MLTEQEYLEAKRKQRGLRAFYPLFGLVLFIAFSVIAYFIGEPVLDFANRFFPALPQGERTVYIWVTRGLVLFLILMVFSIIYAVAAPKPSLRVPEQKLEKERKKALEEKAAERKRQQKLRVQMARELRESSERNKRK